MLAGTDFAESIAEAARTLNKPRRLDDTLQTIVEVACNSVPGFDHVGIATLETKGAVTTRASTGDLVLHLDEVQYGLREGPCSATLQGDAALCVSSLGVEQRWPGYVPQARAAGVRSQLAVKLYLDKGTLGGINFYSTTSDEVSPDAQALARLFATHAAIALGHAQERETFTEGLQTRRAIGQAIGILMERYEMNEDRAFAFLVRASSHANIKLRAVAQEVVDEGNARMPQTRSQQSLERQRHALVLEAGRSMSLEEILPLEWAAIERAAPGARVLLEAVLGVDDDPAMINGA